MFAHQANSGTDMLVLFVQMEEHGALILKAVNAQFPQHGMELLVLFALVVEFIIMLLINANALVDKLIMVMFVL